MSREQLLHHVGSAEKLQIPESVSPNRPLRTLLDSPLPRMVIGGTLGLFLTVGISYFASGGTPLPELMLQASINKHQIWHMTPPELYQQVVTATAFLGGPLGALFGSASHSEI